MWQALKIHLTHVLPGFDSDDRMGCCTVGSEACDMMTMGCDGCDCDTVCDRWMALGCTVTGTLTKGSKAVLGACRVI